MYALLLALGGACAWEEDTSSYRTVVRDDLPAAAATNQGTYEGTLGPPEQMVAPVEIGTATTTREGSGGPPMRSSSEPAPEQPLPRMQVRGADPDAHRSTLEPPAGLDR